MTAKTFTPTYELLCCPTCLLPKESCCCQKQVSEELEGKIIMPSFNPHWMVHTRRSTWDDDPENRLKSEACMKRQNRELKAKASSPEDFNEELKIKKRRGDNAFPLTEKIIEDEKPTHKFPKRFYHEGRNGLTYPKRHHTECCGTSCPSKTSGYCLYQKMFEYCSARRSELDQISFARDGRRCRHFCHKCCLTKRLAFEPLCREEDYGQYRMCGYIPQNGGLPLVTGYFGRRGLGYEDEYELVFNQKEGEIQYFEEAFRFLPEPDEDCVQMYESKITQKPTPLSFKESLSIPPPLPSPSPPLSPSLYGALPPLRNTSARTVPSEKSPNVKPSLCVSSCIIC